MSGGFAETAGGHLVEGVARVVVVDAARTWLEPEQTSSCGACASAAACGVKSGQNDRRLKARRFSVSNDAGLRVGDRVVIGMSEYALIRASSVAYAIPLLSMMVGAVVAHLYFGSDGAAMLSAAGGLLLGVLVARIWAARLQASGDLSPHLLRRIGPGEDCHV